MNTYRALAVAVVVLVVFLGSAYALFQQPTYIDRFRDVFTKGTSGFFILQTSAGSVAVTESGGELTELLADASAQPLIAHGVITPDRSRGAAMRFSPNVVEVVSFTLGASSEVQVLATHTVADGDLGGRVTNPVWSADNRTLAYRFSPSIPETVFALEAGPQGAFDPLGGVNSESEVQLAEEYLPAVYVASLDQPAVRLSVGTPVAFSPDGRSLLVEESSALSLVVLKTGERVQVSGGPVVGSSTRIPLQLRMVSGASHLLVWAPTERIEVYELDWDRGVLTRLGEIPDGESAQDVLLDSARGERALVVTADEEQHRVHEYRLSTSIKSSGSYEITTPPDARLLQWFYE